MKKIEVVERLILDKTSEGFVYIDKDCKIKLYNKQAKEIFGLITKQGQGHKAGVIEKNDLVIIADNSMGRDDGNLCGDDLKKIGIKEKAVEVGDAIVAVGFYENKEIKPIYKVKKKKEWLDKLEVNTDFYGEDIKIKIDFILKEISITINNFTHKTKYLYAYGDIVIFDTQEREVKFYQDRGYTIKKESLKKILMGNRFREKNMKTTIDDMIGKDIVDIHGIDPVIEEFTDIATGKNIVVQNKVLEISGRTVMCTLTPVDIENERKGALLKIEDINDFEKLIREKNDVLQKLRKAEKKLKNQEIETGRFKGIIGESVAIRNVKSLTYKAARTNSTIIILGESGTGKSVLAKGIHENSKRKNKPFVNVNCASLTESLIESELFGYEKGAFTGAKNSGKKGFFEVAVGGTIFLDEIAEISLRMQAKLLNVIQNKTIFRVGGNKKIDLDVRIIAATNKNLEKAVKEGRFREDLYYRLNVFPILIPPLRNRKEDIDILAKHLIVKICDNIGMDKKHISGEALYTLMNYEWPGNIRELENILERAINICEGNNIMSEHLLLPKKMGEVSVDKSTETLKEILQRTEKQAILNTLTYLDNDKKLAMKKLGLKKTAFYEKLKKYEILQ